MNAATSFLLLALSIACAKAAVGEVGGRVKFDYPDIWEATRAPAPAGDLLKVQSARFVFSVYVVRQSKVAVDLSMPDVRKAFIRDLAGGGGAMPVTIESVKVARAFEKEGHEGRGFVMVHGLKIQFRIVLLVDSGDVIVVQCSAVEDDPMTIPSLDAAWKSVSIKNRA